jgi:hypothetical protein
MGATEKLIVALPAPEVAEVIVSQPVLLELAFQEQPVPAVSPTDPVPPVPLKSALLGLRLYTHVPLCVMLKLELAILTLNIRELGLGFGATESATVPLPVPGAPDKTETAPLPTFKALQAQPAPAATFTSNAPPTAAILALEGESAARHDESDWISVAV